MSTHTLIIYRNQNGSQKYQLLCKTGWNSFKHFFFTVSMVLSFLSRRTLQEVGTPCCFPVGAQTVNSVGMRMSHGLWPSHMPGMCGPFLTLQPWPGLVFTLLQPLHNRHGMVQVIRDTVHSRPPAYNSIPTLSVHLCSWPPAAAHLCPTCTHESCFLPSQ